MEILLNNLDLWSFLFNIVGSITIVISLVYLAKQNKLTNKIAAGESERECFDSFNEIVNKYSSLEDLELIQRAFADYNGLSYAEKGRFNLIYLIPHINNFEQFYRLNQLNMMADIRVERTANLVVAMLRTPGGKEAWKELQHVFNPEIVAYINQVDKTSEVPPMFNIFHWLEIDKE